jgi:DNA-binding NarL/FixJ family response regulator
MKDDNKILHHTCPAGSSLCKRVSQKGKQMRVFLADDQAKVRSALRLLLEYEPGWRVVGEAAEANSLLSQVEVTQPDLMLLDWELPGPSVTNASPGSGSRLLSALRAHCPHLRVIVLSGRPEARQAALAAGADAFVSKGDPPEQLLTTLRAIEETIKRPAL